MTEETINLHGTHYTQNKICSEPDEYLRLEAVEQGFALKRLISDKSHLVRSTVARLKYGHEQLATDPNWRVRANVARYCKPRLLIHFINDENHFVRYIVVQRGYHLEHFITDSDEEIADLARYQLQNKR
ncbi:MAG: hypothetical protein methR_P1408 [Methyloprofundus sp.]|nr:MAG: hypothetical protein methR_P1408 [Methyloprofundus sp.]